MSCCLILQMKDIVCIGADTATSIQSGDNFIRYSNNGKKIFEIGKDIVYCSGNMSYVPEVIDNIRLQNGYVDVMYLSRYLKKKTFAKAEGFEYPSIGVLICRVVNGVSYVYDLSESRDFDVVTHTVTQNGIQIWAGGIHNEKCLETATRNIQKFNREIIQTYIHTYKEMVCQEIGGNINVYYMDSNRCQKIIDNYDLNDGYTTFLSGSGLIHGLLAPAIVGELICGKNMFIGNQEKSVQITGDGIKITNGTITWGEDNVNAPEIENINGLKNSLTSIEGNLEQLDGRIQTYSQPTDPKTTGSTKWNNSDNEKHLGDVWVNTEDGVVYVFSKEGSTYKWMETQDSNLKALALSKAQVFTSKSSTISNGYSIGDLWILESDTVLNGYKKGTVLIAIANAGKNNTFHKNHWQDATVKNATDALEEVTVFKGEVNQALMGDATTSIGKDYVISPKIGGGYMYITGNNGTSIEINPKGTEFDGHNGDYVFNISKDDELIMGVDNDGNGHFKGKITGSEISGGKIDSKSTDGRCYTNIIDGEILSYDNRNNNNSRIYGGCITLSENSSNCDTTLSYCQISISDVRGAVPYFSASNTLLDVRTDSNFLGDVYISENLTVVGGINTTNNLSTLGTANYRWNEVYTSNSSITTSDRNLKENIKPLSKKHIDFFRLLAPVSFTFKDGKSGRTHIGFISQDVEKAMNKVGLTDLDFAGFCKDIKTTVKCDEDGNETEEPELDENGNVQYIYSLRYGEFITLNTYMIQNTMNKIDKLEQENKQLEERLERLETLVSNYTN